MREVLSVPLDGATLVGTLHVPAGGCGGRIAFLFLNAGYAPRDGHGGLGVVISDRLARDGFPAFRFDLPMLGDASGDLPETIDQFLEVIYSGVYAKVTLELLRALRSRYGIDAFVVGGLCAATITAVYAAERDLSGLVVGLVLLEPELVLLKAQGPSKARTLARLKRRLPRVLSATADRAFSYWGWMRLVTREGRMASWLPLPRRAVARLVFRRRKLPAVANRPLVAAWRATVGRRLPVFVVTASGKLRELFFDQINAVSLRGLTRPAIEHLRVERTNHVFTTGGAAETISEALASWSGAVFGGPHRRAGNEHA